MKNDFISSVSHELRTPLTAIKGWAETLQTGGIGRETYDKGMNVIVREANAFPAWWRSFWIFPAGKAAECG